MTHRRGFTLVELNIAMAFVAVLLLMVAAMTIHISRLYERGVTVKTINQAGREVMSQLRTDISVAQPDKTQFIELSQTGRLCLGEVSYLYNRAEGLNTESTNNLFRRGTQPIRLVRVLDSNASWCELNGSVPVLGTSIPDNLFSGGTAAELLVRDEFVPIALHNMAFQATGTNQPLYQLSLLLGTNQPGTFDGESCRPPTDNLANFNQCFVVDFATIIRAGEISS